MSWNNLMLRLPGLTSALSTVVPYALEGPGYIPEGFKYLGITETTWASAPAASKGQEVTSNGVTYPIVGSDVNVEQ
jgi:hypothetical protein